MHWAPYSQSEDDDNWLWFLKQLHQIIQDQAKEFLELNKLTILSDCQKGLIEGLFPSTYISD